jgi:hypothetical protein
MAAILAVAAAKKHSEVRQHGEGACDGRGNGHDERVAILDVGEFVSNDPRPLFRREQFEQPGRCCNCAMLRIAPGCERVWLRIVHDIDAGHRQPGALGQFGHDVHQLGLRMLVDVVSAMH